MQVFKVNTTAYEEEDFFLLADLAKEQIIEAMTPVVMEEREGGKDYDNETLLYALRKRYPSKKIEIYVEFETIII